MELRARARRLRRDRVAPHGEPVRAGDLDDHVLAARREDLVVDERVPRVRRERLLGEVLPAQSRQNPDHHEVYADGGGPRLGGVEALPDARLERAQPVATQLAWWHVDLDVELAQFGDEVGVGDLSEYRRRSA
jgi:hypothetical protein